MSLKSAEFDFEVKFDKLYYSGLQFMYSMSAAVNKMTSPTSHFVCMVTCYSFLIRKAGHQ